jgi:hypothetical protein
VEWKEGVATEEEATATAVAATEEAATARVVAATAREVMVVETGVGGSACEGCACGVCAYAACVCGVNGRVGCVDDAGGANEGRVNEGRVHGDYARVGCGHVGCVRGERANEILGPNRCMAYDDGRVPCQTSSCVSSSASNCALEDAIHSNSRSDSHYE